MFVFKKYVFTSCVFLLNPIRLLLAKNSISDSIQNKTIGWTRKYSDSVVNMTSIDPLKPPETVCGMINLRKEAFTKLIKVPCLHVKTYVEISKILPYVKKYLLKLEHFRPVQRVDSGETVIYLNPNLVSKWEDLPDKERNDLQQLSADLLEKEITLKYEHYSAEDIFRAVLPADKEGFSSYTKTGHIVHVNLREHLLPFKCLIGEVLHDKVSGCRSVVNKLDMIDTEYRNFKMEVLCGENDMVTRVKESKCLFELDFSTVYWNSRLSTEHERIVNKLNSGDVVFDVFAGVGPFSIPAAKKRCIVYANDLNPDSYKWLNQNKKINKISDIYLKTYNKDGKDFILNEIKTHLPNYINKHKVYVIMNLPSMAVEFLSNFVGLLKESDVDIKSPAVLFVYCFAKGDNPADIAKNLVTKNIPFDINDKILETFNVRTVSSLKEMMRVTIQLDNDILLVQGASKRTADENETTNSKKCNFFKYLPNLTFNSLRYILDGFMWVSTLNIAINLFHGTL